ncbi:PREDICTED: uncharacterized protein LOC104588878 [Nelumbo nucifera]|uniref:Uncharacterized protein LOC104588878 n=1 Tax=Nelumbo nucifera TaxID=4432 RepID=A0A1U7ZD63_NELNU|nr:PREDICTED: uncharacterized protein LOC104588878 [Nelumbo nucifera]
MIVRTYARRNRCVSRNFSDSSFNGGVDDSYEESLPEESSQEIYSVAFSSQDSSPWSFDTDLYGLNSSQGSLSALPPRAPGPDFGSHGDGVARKLKKPRVISRESGEIKNHKSLISKGVRSLPAPATSTLMEAQEFGEMMEHVDEVNFALDGLRRGQPSRIRRASLLSLLSICATAQQRRLLRTQGMAKTIVDSIMGLSFDDSPSTLAAAALFYILASDGQDDHLLDSPTSISFLLKLLKPPLANTVENKAPTIGCKLLALRKDPVILRDTTKKLDSSSSAVISKVEEILLSCKEINSCNGDNEGMGRPELSPKWIALLTMEKACLSTVSLEDTSGTIRRVGGNFKERLRELGGLDAVFDVTVNCHSTMERLLKSSSPSIRELKDDAALESVVLLLKCLKIMENATFLSKDNQDHLLGMREKLVCEGSSLSFAGLIISVIKILSGLSLLQSSSSNSNDAKSQHVSDGTSGASEIPLREVYGVDRNSTSSCNSSKECCSMDNSSSLKSFRLPQKHQLLPPSQSELSISNSETTTASPADVCSIKKFDSSSASGSYDKISRALNGGFSVNSNRSKMNIGLSKRATNTTEDMNYGSNKDCQDPFAFDEDELKPSKWELLSMRKKASRVPKSKMAVREIEDGCEPLIVSSQHGSNNGENHHDCDISFSSSVREKNSNLLEDCLLSAVKVLMNLTNDNSVGCKQIAASGGLETMSSLIVCHFPAFSSCSSEFCRLEENILPPRLNTELNHQNERHLTDHELDFLVAILGLLVNLVEKDSQNRSQLAAASVSLPSSRGSEGKANSRGVIPLLCSIFLANQGAGEAAGEGILFPGSDEAAMLQGEREAEKMILEAYAALLLAFLSTESKNVRNTIAGCLPDNNLKVLVPVLERFVAFHLTLNMISPETHTAVSEVIESCRCP